MLGTHDLALFAATVFVLNATPGVDMMLVLASTLKRGVRAGLMTALGVAAGCVVHTLLAAFGLAALLATSAAAFSVLKLVGAAYLVWLAIGMFRAAARAAADAAESPADVRTNEPAALARESSRATGWPAFRRGVLTNALNPKVALFFLALLPQFIDADAPHKTLAFLFLGAWVIVQGFAFLAGFVLLVAPLRRGAPSRRLRSVLNAAGGSLFVLLAARLAWPERP
ncbi:MAG: LysE family translocator [Bacteriovorax sp.]|nr:LysE family translocator [Rhizobacter sp.]